MLNEFSQHICDFLKECDIKFSCYSHKPIYTLKEGLEIADKLGVIPCKCLLLVNRQRQHYMLISDGANGIDLRFLANLIKSSRLSFAPSNDLDTLLHTIPGAVSPLELIFDSTRQIELIVDERLLGFSNLIFAPCVNDKSIVIHSKDFFNIFLPAVNHSLNHILKLSGENTLSDNP